MIAYMSLREPILDERAIFSDASQQFRIPVEPDINEPTKVFIRTAKQNIDAVYLCYSGKRIPIEVDHSDEMFDFYAGVADG